MEVPPSVLTPPGRQPTVNVPFCRIALVIEKQINVEVWMPRDWNGMFQGVGNGGLTGAINYAMMGMAIKRGFATASTDTGHISEGVRDTSWIPGNPERVVNFGHHAHHLMAETAKKAIAGSFEALKNLQLPDTRVLIAESVRPDPEWRCRHPCLPRRGDSRR